MNTAKQTKRGRPRDPERMKRVIEAASEQFLEQGYERASMEAVAQASGVSKMTLYNYFPSKDALFEACVACRTDALFAGFDARTMDTARPADVLTQIARQFLALMRADDVLRIHRALFGLAGIQPDVCERFFKAGPQRITDLVKDYLTSADAIGSLRIDDCARAADQFLALQLGRHHVAATLGLGVPDQASDEAMIQDNVAMFLACYGVPGRRIP